MRRIVQGLDAGRRREKNEDFVLVDPKLRLGIVADGVGGHRGGDRAARLVAESVHKTLLDQSWVIERIRQGDRGVDAEDLAKVTRYALNRASKIIHQEAEESLELKGMSTTCTLFLDLGGRGLVAHVGDSRAYLVRSGQVLRVTEDHVVAVASGRQDGGKPVKQRVLSRAVGNAPEVPVDVLWVELRPTDSVLLCSDGLSDQLASEEEIAEVLEAFGPEASPEVFVDLANVRGGPDNIGVVVFGPEEGTNDLPAPRTPWEETKAQLQVLRNLPPFASLAYFELELLRPHVRVDVYPVDAQVALDLPAAAVVAKGRLALAGSPEAKIEVGPGALLGETSLTTERPWPYVATALEQTVLLVLPVRELLGFVADRPFASSRLLWAFLSTASERSGLLARAHHGPLDSARPEATSAVSTVSTPPSPAPKAPSLPPPAAPPVTTAAAPPPTAPSAALEAPPPREAAASAPAAETPAAEPASLASAFSPPPAPKGALKLPPMPPIGAPFSPPPAAPASTAPSDAGTQAEAEAAPAALEARAPEVPDEELSDPWGYDPRDLEAPVPKVTPVEALSEAAPDLFEGRPSALTLPPPASSRPSGEDDERGTIPPPAHRRPTDPPPEDKPA